MICKEVREHQKRNNNQIDMRWFAKHVSECKECKKTMDAAEAIMEEIWEDD